MHEQPSSLVEMFVRQCSLNPLSLLYGTLVPSSRWFGISDYISSLKIKYLPALKMTLALVEYLNDTGNLNGERLGDVVGIYAVNRYECMIAEYAMYILRKPTCVIYKKEKKENIEYVLKDTEMETCFMSAECAKFMVEKELLDSTKLKNVILLDEKIDEIEEFERRGIRVHPFSVIVKQETEFSKKRCVVKALSAWRMSDAGSREVFNETLEYIKSLGLILPTKDDVATICYTSGTTGAPKGAELTHQNFLALIDSFDQNQELIQPRKTDVYFSYLPMAHVFEKAVTALVVSRGGSIWFGRGKTEKTEEEQFAEDLVHIRPTIFAAVPKILERMLKKVRIGIDERINSSRILKYCHEKWPKGTMKYMKRKAGKIKLGAERMRVCVSGSAYLHPDVCTSMQEIFGCPVLQGYGMTETTAGVFIRPLKSDVLDTVGVPLARVEVKLAHPRQEDVGSDLLEICVRGDTVFKRYYKNEEATAEAFDEEGWFRTGDVAVEEHGMYKITDRISNTVKLNNGTYVALEMLEATFNLERANDIFVFVSPDRSGIHVVLFSEDEGLKQELEEKVARLIETNQIRYCERPKAIFVVNEEKLGEKVENFWTPTGKKKRRALLNKLRERNLV